MRLGDRKAALGEFQKSLAIRQKLYDEQPDATLRQSHKQPIMLLLARCGDHTEKDGKSRGFAQREIWLKKQENGVSLSEIASGFALCIDAVAPEKQKNQLALCLIGRSCARLYVELAAANLSASPGQRLYGHALCGL